MQYFRDAEELLVLFGIDPAKPGAEDFYVLAELYGLMSQYPQYRVSVADLAKLRMKERKLSPRVFWSRMKRTIRPLIEADASTLRALGVPCGYTTEDHVRTCPELIGDVGSYTGAFLEGADADNAEAAADIARECGHAK